MFPAFLESFFEYTIFLDYELYRILKKQTSKAVIEQILIKSFEIKAINKQNLYFYKFLEEFDFFSDQSMQLVHQDGKIFFLNEKFRTVTLRIKALEHLRITPFNYCKLAMKQIDSKPNDQILESNAYNFTLSQIQDRSEIHL